MTEKKTGEMSAEDTVIKLQVSAADILKQTRDPFPKTNKGYRSNNFTRIRGRYKRGLNCGLTLPPAK